MGSDAHPHTIASPPTRSARKHAPARASSEHPSTAALMQKAKSQEDARGQEECAENSLRRPALRTPARLPGVKGGGRFRVEGLGLRVKGLGFRV